MSSMTLVNAGAPTASAANCASGGPVPTPRPPGWGATTAGGTSGSAAAGATLGGGAAGAAISSVGCVAAGLGAGFAAGGLGTKARGGGICWASATTAPTSHAATHAVSGRVHLMSLGSAPSTNIVNIATFYATSP